ncbi:NAD(P)-dependent oxidoreductase [Erysipelothrix larvae]|uniref:NAD(P)-dependent oxidoreductase n=1 Tax=Erysipelothrix larvae TaxID=1514105 RepID=A0A0X8GZ62_9FIRM|nr:NmrA family NAD(P)-binding protein [Erysipelothrix larvae]AMC93130.1 NAD(P)-dependent oxidoreductase [Erysipelothrix larvae]
MGRILVTGASGNVGKYVVKYALQNNQEVTACGIDPNTLKTMFGDTVKIAAFDFLNPSTFNNALEDVDRVFIMRPPHLGNPNDLKPFIDALKKQGNIKLVSFLSLIGVENNPVPPHHKIEKYIEKVGLPYCHIRPSFFMQNISGIHAFEIKHFNRIVVPVKNALTSFIDAQDIGEITAKVLSEPNQHQNTGYSITGPEAIDYWEVARILSHELQREILYANPKPSFAKKYWIQIRGLDKEYCTVMGMLYMMTRFGTAKKVTSIFEEVMHKKPQTFQQFAHKNRDTWI